MVSPRANHLRVKLHRSYTVPELAACLHVHRNTVRQWLRSGLKPIDASRPMLFHGGEVRAFLFQRVAGRKRPCPPGTLYCLRCRVPRPPALGMLDCVVMSTTGGNLRALCEACGGMMHRRVRLVDLPAKMPNLDVRITHAPSSLSGSPAPSVNSDFGKQVTT